MHLIDMSSLLILFQAKSGVLHLRQSKDKRVNFEVQNNVK